MVLAAPQSLRICMSAAVHSGGVKHLLVRSTELAPPTAPLPTQSTKLACKQAN